MRCGHRPGLPAHAVHTSLVVLHFSFLYSVLSHAALAQYGWSSGGVDCTTWVGSHINKTSTRIETFAVNIKVQQTDKSRGGGLHVGRGGSQSLAAEREQQTPDCQATHEEVLIHVRFGYWSKDVRSLRGICGVGAHVFRIINMTRENHVDGTPKKTLTRVKLSYIIKNLRATSHMYTYHARS